MKFLLPILALSSLASAQKEARFVRIELPGKGRTLTLAEVEVMAGGKNIARFGKASQSTTSNNAGAERAIDGNKNPGFSSGGQTHTIEGKKDAWWEVDLGKTSKVDSISVWNRNEGDLGKRLDGFTLSLLDAKKRRFSHPRVSQLPRQPSSLISKRVAMWPTSAPMGK
ncbi:discoidin domain-containing protein [Akkermansiaceae bacterium]|nr:discoidin domain-containing protein [Akkermansiaceae bacterium]